SILCSIIILSALGQTMNLMTLGGLALAVGILVDDATVEIENIHRNLAMKKPMVRAILDGASQIAVPAFVSTLCICIVFVPIFFLSGTARFLFQPARSGSDLRHARFLFSLAHSRPDDGEISSRRTSRRNRHQPGRWSSRSGERTRLACRIRRLAGFIRERLCGGAPQRGPPRRPLSL